MITNTVKLEVQNDGMDLIKDHDALKRKGGKGKKKGGKQQKVVQVAMTRYQGSPQLGKVLPGGDVIVLFCCHCRTDSICHMVHCQVDAPRGHLKGQQQPLRR